MNVLGIIDSKPSTAALLVDGKIVSAISEERLNRKKMANGLPVEAITKVMELSGIHPKEIDVIAIAQKHKLYEPEPLPWPGWFEDDRKTKKHRLNKVVSTVAPYVGKLPIALEAYHSLKNLISRDRQVKLPKLLKEEYGLTAPVRFFDHHYCHAASAYYTSSFEQALVFTLDGGGDSKSGSVYLGEGGCLTELTKIDSFHSLGNLYSYCTALCGFKAEKHEGKVTGLAALGEPIYAPILRKFIAYEEPGQIRYTIPMYHRSAIQRIKESLPEDFDRAALAASIQLVLEEVGTAFFRYWIKKTGIRKVALAGGVFSNVKFNQRIHEIEELEEIFIHPAMDDSGLSVGGAFAALVQEPTIKPVDLVQRLENVYFGPGYSDQEIERAVLGSKCEATYVDNVHEGIASLLSKGHVVARFTGRMEYGPRALGHRSILYQTMDPSVNDWLNERLKRTEFMPFAPATLVEYADQCFSGIKGAEDPARFMTITFECTPEMRKTSPGVVHVDGTARPQIIDPDTAPDFYGILTEYHKMTGIPSLINTSFNMHEEPIVCSPEDALRSFQQGNLDYLAIGNWLVSHPDSANITTR